MLVELPLLRCIEVWRWLCLVGCVVVPCVTCWVVAFRVGEEWGKQGWWGVAWGVEGPCGRGGLCVLSVREHRCVSEVCVFVCLCDEQCARDQCVHTRCVYEQMCK